MEKEIIFKIGGMWEESEWKLLIDYECSSYGGGEPCKHCTILPFSPKKRTDGSVYNEEEKNWICPKVIIMKNEGGYNSTGLCADCVLEALLSENPPK